MCCDSCSSKHDSPGGIEGPAWLLLRMGEVTHITPKSAGSRDPQLLDVQIILKLPAIGPGPSSPSYPSETLLAPSK